MDGSPTPSRQLNIAGFSPTGGIAFGSLYLALGLIVIVVLRFSKLKPGMPLACTCSLAITAACHSDPTNQDVLKPLKYGLEKLLNGEFRKRNGKLHATFSSGEVEGLVDGEVYV